MEARVPLMIPRQATRGSATTRALVAMMLGLGILGAGSGSALADEPSKLECVQANEAAQSLRQSGKLHDARAQLLVCVATSCPAPVRSDCAERLKEVDKTMPTIIFDVKDKDGIALTAVAVASDGAPLVARLDGTALPVDPGEHVFRFSSEGLPPLERKLVIREGEKDRHEPIALSAASLAEPPAAPVPSSTTHSSSQGSSTSSTQRTIGLATGGVGIVAVVVGAVLGLVAKSTYNNAISYCPSGPPSPCSSQGVRESGTAHDQATASTVAFVAGAALLAGGTAIYLTAPRDGGVSVGPTAFVGGAGLGLRGTW
ncbi:MAG: hypothetical protein ACLQBL_15740 [Polyangiaceae bacterium]